MRRTRTVGVGLIVGYGFALVGCAYDGRPVVSMDDQVRAMGIEVARAEVQSCIDHANRIRGGEPGAVTKGVTCGVVYTALVAAAVTAAGATAAEISSLDPSTCFVPTDKEAYQVIVNDCLVRKGFKVLVWRE